MAVRQLLSTLWRRKWIVVFTVLLASIATAIGSGSLVPRYAATATLWVPASTGGSVGNGDILLNDRLINTYAELTTSQPVLLELQRRLGVAPSAAARAVKAKSVAQTELLQITVQDPNPFLAAEMATNLAGIVIAETQKTDAGRSLRVSLFAQATVPEDPVWLGLLPTPYWRELNVLLAFALSLFAGMGLAFFFEYLDATLYSKKQIEEAASLEALAVIPVARRWRQSPVLNGSRLDDDAFHYLRASLHCDRGQPSKAYVITSALRGEGKSTVTANLALSIARAGCQVIAIDANLHSPRLHALFDVPNEPGLSQLLAGEADLQQTLRESKIAGVRILPSGSRPTNAAELLDSPRMAATLEQLKGKADVLLLDTPALLVTSEAAVLASRVDGAIMVVACAHAYREAVESAVSQLAGITGRADGRVGLVINRADRLRP